MSAAGTIGSAALAVKNAPVSVKQHKINAYIAFWETMQYKKIYHGCSFASAKIELHEKYDPSPNFYKFLKTARNYMKKLNMKIEVLSNIEAKDVLDE